jgi:hypothetical protein
MGYGYSALVEEPGLFLSVMGEQLQLVDHDCRHSRLKDCSSQQRILPPVPEFDAEFHQLGPTFTRWALRPEVQTLLNRSLINVVLCALNNI